MMEGSGKRIAQILNQDITIAVDFDGVIHQYSLGWHDGTIYDIPVRDAFSSIQLLLDFGMSVFIFTSRNAYQIQEWLAQQGTPFVTEVVPDNEHFWQNKLKVVGITNRKLPAFMYIDDRALPFTRWDHAMMLLYAELLSTHLRRTDDSEG